MVYGAECQILKISDLLILFADQVQVGMVFKVH